MKDLQYAVLGSGSWATAIIKMLLYNTDKVYWYIRNPEKLKYIRKYGRNPDYLRTVVFDKTKLLLSGSSSHVVAQADVVILVIPSPYLKKEIEHLDFTGKKVITSVKGVIPEEYVTVSTYLKKSLHVQPRNLFMISGPCHAEEVASDQISYLTISNSRVKRAKELCKVFKSPYIKTKASRDLLGAELAAMLKNIYAIASGIGNGLGYGDNFQAVLVSSAIREMRQIIREFDKRKRDVDESAYLGDLLVTTYSSFSRNRTFGNMLGKGYTVKSAFFEMTMVVEGYYASKGIYELIKKIKFKPPIVNAVYDILYEDKRPIRVFSRLINKLS